MKKLITLLLLVVSYQLSAQISYEDDSAKVVGSASEFQLTAKNHITNNSSDSLFRFVRLTKTCGMESAVCDQLYCYDTDDDSMDIKILPGTSFDMKVNFYPNNVESNCDLLVYVKSLQNPANYDSSFYYCKTDNFNSITKKVTKQAKIYPNPAESHIQIISLNQGAFDVAIFDILGNQVLTFNRVQNKQALNIAALSKGVYIIKTIGEFTETSGVRKL